MMINDRKVPLNYEPEDSNGELEEIVIPKECNIIKKEAYANCKKLKKVIFKCESLEIQDEAFAGCTELEEITLPEIWLCGKGVFSGCTKLKKIVFSNDTGSIGVRFAMNCESLEEVVLPKRLYSIQDEAFAGCIHLSEVFLPSRLTKMGKGVFKNCNNLSKVGPFDGLLRIDEDAFWGCKALKTIDLGSVGIIEKNAFVNTAIRNVTITAKQKRIEDGAFDEGVVFLGENPQRQVLFKDQPKDFIAVDCVGRERGNLFFKLFPISEKDGHEAASVVVEAWSGALCIEYSDQVFRGSNLKIETSYSGISYSEMYGMAKKYNCDKYLLMTEENYLDFLSGAVKEEIKKSIPKVRTLKNEEYATEAIKADWIFVHLKQLNDHEIYFFRKTQTSYRLLSILTKDKDFPSLIGYHEIETKKIRKIYREERIMNSFMGLSIGTQDLLLGDDEEDIVITGEELEFLKKRHSDLCSFKILGGATEKKIPISQYVNDHVFALCCCKKKVKGIAGYGNMMELINTFRQISKDELYTNKRPEFS